MSLFEYQVSRELVKDDPPFYALIMAAMRRADTPNLAALTLAFPAVRRELQERYDAPAGILPTDNPPPPVPVRGEIFGDQTTLEEIIEEVKSDPAA